ncbi:hypothetical protein CRG98_020834 [Punica granatum]|uniref:Uncharacterized protein n=1 Tax=Punica granatum TaxID=22663 RepID=A0A2I0JR59_PUNGR|nr:hypothetical protein CRG98_020834 [Punica granatum]
MPILGSLKPFSRAYRQFDVQFEPRTSNARPIETRAFSRFLLMGRQLVHFGRNCHSRVNSASVTRPRTQPSVRQHARARATLVTTRKVLLPSPRAPVRLPNVSHVLPRACMHTCTRDAPNVCLRIRTLVTAHPRARPRPTKCPAPARAPDTTTASLAVRSKPSRVPNVHSSAQPSHPTLKHFPDSFLVSRGQVWIVVRKTIPTREWQASSRQSL